MKVLLIQQTRHTNMQKKIFKRVNPYRLRSARLYLQERMNPMPKSKDSKTHFEQVPLEIVKKIAKEDIPDDEGNEPDVDVDPPARK